MIVIIIYGNIIIVGQFQQRLRSIASFTLKFPVFRTISANLKKKHVVC